MWTVELIVMAMMIAANSVLAAYEIALASVAESRLSLLADKGGWGSAAALRMKQSMESSLAVVQLGITLVGAVAAATGGAGAEESLVPLLSGLGLSKTVTEFIAIAMVVLPLTYVTIVFGELIPKLFALRNKEWICLTLSPVMEWFGTAVRPAVWVLESSVKLVMRPRPADTAAEEAPAMQELRASAAVARVMRLIGRREEDIIVNAAELTQHPVREIMIPVKYISHLWVEDSLASALLSAHRDMHTRFPVTESAGDAQQILGYVNFKDLVAAMRLSPQGATVRNLLRPIHSFPAETSVAECLDYLIRGHSHIALVRDEDNKVLGMITLEDILEEIVGDIRDEYDQLPSYIIATGAGWVVGGDAKLDRLSRMSGLEFPPPESDGEPPQTLNQWMLARLGRPVERGEEVRIDGGRILVRKVRRQFVLEAQVSRDAADARA